MDARLLVLGKFRLDLVARPLDETAPPESRMGAR